MIGVPERSASSRHSSSERWASGTRLGCSRHATRNRRVCPCEEPCTWPGRNCSNPSTSTPRAATRHRALEPIAPRPITATSASNAAIRLFLSLPHSRRRASLCGAGDPAVENVLSSAVDNVLTNGEIFKTGVDSMTKPPRRRHGTTIPDVARVAGVSAATAARALGGYGAVSPQTLASVRAAAEQLGYRPNELARSMITGKTNTIGAIVADIENPFFARVTRGITDAARAAGFEVILVNTDEDLASERSALKVLLDKQVDGVVVAPASSHEAGHLREAQECGADIVLIDRRVAGLEADAVLIDNRTAARDAVQRLLGAGHRRIALVTGSGFGDDEAPVAPRRLSTGTERIEGYLAALEAAGVPECAKYLRATAVDQPRAERLTAELLALDAPPTALFASDLVVALGALRAIQAAGLTIPAELTFVAFDDADWTTVLTPRLSVVAQPAYDMGVKAAKTLIDRINGNDAQPREYLLPTTFVERESIARPVTTA